MQAMVRMSGLMFFAATHMKRLMASSGTELRMTSALVRSIASLRIFGLLPSSLRTDTGSVFLAASALTGSLSIMRMSLLRDAASADAIPTFPAPTIMTFILTV